MRRLLTLELRKLARPVLLTLILSTAVFLILTCTLFQNYTLCYLLDKWEIGTEFMELIFPLLVTVPVCWQLYYERRDRFLVYTLPRIAPGPYLRIKWMACALCAFALLFIPYFLSALCALYFAPYGELHPEWVIPYRHFLQTLYTRFPLVYAALLSLWKGLLGVQVMSFGFLLALYSANIFVVLTGPFVYVLLDNFAWSSVRIPHTFIGSFEPSLYDPGIMSPLTIVWGPLQLALVLFLVAQYYTRVRKRPIYAL